MGPNRSGEEPRPLPRPAGQGRDSLEDRAEILRRRVIAAVKRTYPWGISNRAEDVVQSVMLRLLALSKKSEGEKRFSSVYLERTVYSAVVDELRRACNRREVLHAEENAMERIREDRADPERQTVSGEIGRGIQDCLGRLARPRRLAVTLYLQGCSVPRAALHLRWTVKKTENLVYRGLADMRACLGAKGLRP